MDQQVSNRRAVAGVLVTLIRQHLVAHHASTILRTTLHASVPVSERPDIRRGVDALVEHGLLAQSGEQIGFTAKGLLFLAHVQQRRSARTPAAEREEESAAGIASVLAAIDHDARFETDGSFESVESLPARLEADLAPPRKSALGNKWIALLCLLVLAALVYLLKR